MKWCYFRSLFVCEYPETRSLEFSCGGTFAYLMEVCL